MTKAWTVVLLLLVGFGAVCADAMAADAPADANQPAAKAPAGSDGSWSKSFAVIGACIGAALAAAGGGYGVGRIGSSCIESIARQPEAARDMFAPMVVAAGMVEVGMLFAIVVCLVSLFL